MSEPFATIPGFFANRLGGNRLARANDRAVSQCVSGGVYDFELGAMRAAGVDEETISVGLDVLLESEDRQVFRDWMNAATEGVWPGKEGLTLADLKELIRDVEEIGGSPQRFVVSPDIYAALSQRSSGVVPNRFQGVAVASSLLGAPIFVSQELSSGSILRVPDEGDLDFTPEGSIRRAVEAAGLDLSTVRQIRVGSSVWAAYRSASCRPAPDHRSYENIPVVLEESTVALPWSVFFDEAG